MLLDAKRSTLLIVDVQENLAPVMADTRSVLRGCALLMRAAARLDIPVVVSEQYPKGLGPTVGELLQWAPEGARMEKLHFSCAWDAGIKERLDSLGRDQVVVAGIEAHVCVLQTCLGLKQSGLSPAVVADACSSRAADNHRLAMERMRANGVEVTSVEMVLFEWLHCAGTPEFKDISRLIK